MKVTRDGTRDTAAGVFALGLLVTGIYVVTSLTGLLTGNAAEWLGYVTIAAVIGSGAILAIVPASATEKQQQAAAKANRANSKLDLDLRSITDGYSKQIVIRVYSDDQQGLDKANEEANFLAAHGYSITAQSGQGSHVNIGRTVGGAVVTGGISLLFGGSRSNGKVTISYNLDKTAAAIRDPTAGGRAPDPPASVDSVDGIAACLRLLETGPDRFAIFTSDPVRGYYVQVAVVPNGLHLEAVGNQYLAPESQVSLTGTATLRELGWTLGSDGGGNWAYEVPNWPASSSQDVARFIGDTLTHIYRWEAGRAIQVEAFH